MQETELYPPIKDYLEAQGYEVKGEIGAADLVACRDDDEPVVVELKVGFSLALFHQAIERQSMTDAVYIAVPESKGAAFQRSLKNNRSLCRRLGLGLITVRLKDNLVTVQLDPAPYKPRKVKPRKARLLREFARRVGDPNSGGSTRRGLITSYRQDALKCLKLLSLSGPTKAAIVARMTGVDRARPILSDDHYGWFERVSTGIYQMTPKGDAALIEYAKELEGLEVPLEVSGA
ncbi:hypothetical protein SAMN04515647_0181 [Cohaesibacter sp. ES.047]|uniref:DUF2161 domain-containing phosphodiesterase n=1 Tax=Cohaesibacter sp. ES.047 TaxID=1798205 RepID=UPI000BB7B357|nr:DUF2161 family putative PD-(D/E)XK-type phosphodiesterase [Cohaesibacter sp. ES.047]SNY90040.1 hypothetical protein SAMN04515647_0181 [Cohaesibacter sp. ES.047]